MTIALQTGPVLRVAPSPEMAGGLGVMPADCTGVPGSIIGKCFFSDSPPISNFNCAACCAFRTAVGWSGGAFTVNC